MIRTSLNTGAKLLKPFAFSSYKFKNGESLKLNESATNSQQGYLTHEAQRVFEQFFKENPPMESEKSFFDMTYQPKEETMDFNPFKVLGVNKNASQKQIKQAYRLLALKYHPKKDSSMEAAQKFVSISRAYDMLKEKDGRKKSVSFAPEFQKTMRDILNAQMGISKENILNEGNCKIKTAELYSETKSVKKFGDLKEITLQKEYNSNGKLIKFARVEKHNKDGTVQVSEQYDDGRSTKTCEMLECTTKDDKGKKEQPKKEKKEQKKDNKEKKDSKQKKPKA